MSNLGAQFKWPITVSVPTKFLRDHMSRSDINKNLPIVKKGKTLTTVSLHQHHYEELLSDADYYHYSNWDKESEPEMYNLSKSAGVTKSRLLKATSPRSK